MKLIPNICGKGAPNFPSFCGAKAYFKGITDASTPQGVGFDLLQGVTAHDEYGQQIPFTVSPSEVVACQLGVQTFTYEAEGVTKTRNITVTPIANPTISGVPSEPLTVELGETFDPLDGVTAVDGNGNVVAISVELISYRTVIYADGTLIINEPSTDIASNVTAHGTASHVYDAMKPDGSNYVWTTTPETLWHESYAVKSSITAVEIGRPIKPTSMAYWFFGLNYCTSIDLTNLDSSRVTSMAHMFHNSTRIASLNLDVLDTSNVTDFEGFLYEVDALTSVDVTNFDTSNATNMKEMFYRMVNAETIDVSSFNTANVTQMQSMFASNQRLRTIYASSRFVVGSGVSASTMFYDCLVLVGGANTAYDANHMDETYARIDNPPTAPGYFTAKA